MCVVPHRSLRFAAPLLLALAIPPTTGWAWCTSDGCIINGQTHYLWARTWNAQNSLTMPLNPYYIPRTPAQCNASGFACGADCQKGELLGEPNHYGAYPYANSAATGLEPAQLERLGRVPNEMSLGNAMAMPTGSTVTPAPAAPAR